jgi:hypothetical protein
MSTTALRKYVNWYMHNGILISDRYFFHVEIYHWKALTVLLSTTYTKATLSQEQYWCPLCSLLENAGEEVRTKYGGNTHSLE